MTRRSGTVIAAAAALFVVLLWASTSGQTRIWHSPPENDSLEEVPPPTIAVEPEEAAPATIPEESERDVADIPEWMKVLMLVVLLGIFVWVGRILGEPYVLTWRERRKDDDELAVLPDIADAVTEDAATHMAAVQHGSPRNAIVACWVSLEDTVAAAGVRPHPAETPAELTARVLSTYAVARNAIDELAALYREARFSEHELGEAQRDRAVAALGRLHDDLASRRAPAGVQ